MSRSYVSRGGEKLAAALDHFHVEPAGLVCADLGSHVGGFVDCLLQRGAVRVYSVDTSYGTLAWKLRRDPCVTVLERTNAMHLELAEPVDLVTIDVGWTRQKHVLPCVAGLLRTARPPGAESESGPADHTHAPSADLHPSVLTLIKPHYEANPADLLDGVLPEAKVDAVLAATLDDILALGWGVLGVTECPIRGQAGNREFFAHLARR